MSKESIIVEHGNDTVSIRRMKQMLQGERNKWQKCIPLASMPNDFTTLLTYSVVDPLDNTKTVTHSFKPGDRIIVADTENGEADYDNLVVYTLLKFYTENETQKAMWAPGGGGGASGAAAYTPTLNSAPTSSTTTYTYKGKTRQFEIGQFCRVANAQSNTGYDFYQLYDLTTSGNTTTATWKSSTVSPTYDALTHTVIFPTASGVTVDNHTVVFS